MPSVKATMFSTQSLERLYGSRVVVQYHDVDDPAVRAEHSAWLDYFNQEDWPLPVTLLDGEVLFVGGLQPLKLVAAVASVLVREDQ